MILDSRLNWTFQQELLIRSVSNLTPKISAWSLGWIYKATERKNAYTIIFHDELITKSFSMMLLRSNSKFCRTCFLIKYTQFWLMILDLRSSSIFQQELATVYQIQLPKLVLSNDVFMEYDHVSVLFLWPSTNFGGWIQYGAHRSRWKVKLKRKSRIINQNWKYCIEKQGWQNFKFDLSNIIEKFFVMTPWSMIVLAVFFSCPM